MSPTSLAEQLRRWPTASLRTLLVRRPDLATPAPADVEQLALRAGSRASLTRALAGLTIAELAVIDVVNAVRRPAAPRDLSQLTGLNEDAASSALESCQQLALIWQTADGLRAAALLAELLGCPFSGSAPGTAEPDGVPLIRADLNGPPSLATADADPQRVRQTCALAAQNFVERTHALVDDWGRHPPILLSTGGLSLRDAKQTASRHGLSPAQLALIVETAWTAGLIGIGELPDSATAYLPTPEFDLWSEQPVPQRWTALARSWLDQPRRPGLGVLDSDGGAASDKAPHLLTAGLDWPPAAGLRREALCALDGVPDGEVLAPATGLPSLVEHLRWRHPRRPQERARFTAEVLAEASELGIVGPWGSLSFAALTPWGAALLHTSAQEPTVLLSEELPPAVDYVLIQGDHTIVAPGPLTPEVHSLVSVVATPESRGAAATFRITSDSLRQAFDLGWSADQIVTALTHASRQPVPQSVVVLIQDVARTFGQLRVGQAGAFVVAESPALLQEILAHPKAPTWGLRSLTADVAISTTLDAQTLLARLRAVGLHPAIESADGALRLLPTGQGRASRRLSAEPKMATHRTPEQLHARAAAVVSALRRSSGSTARTGTTSSAPLDIASTLAEAVDSRAAVDLTYLNNSGIPEQVRVVPQRLESGWLRALDVAQGRDRTFAVHRLSRVQWSPTGVLAPSSES